MEGLPTAEPVPTLESSLTLGAKAGIGVGAAVGAVAVIVGLVSLFLRRNRKKKPKTAGIATSEHTTWQRSDREGAVEVFGMPPEADSNLRAEMEAVKSPRHAELEG